MYYNMLDTFTFSMLSPNKNNMLGLLLLILSPEGEGKLCFERHILALVSNL